MGKGLFSLIASTVLVLSACEKQPATPASSGSAPSASETKKDFVPPAGDPKKESPPSAPKSTGDAPKGPGHGGAVVELGVTTLDGMKIKASRDAGEIKAGGDSPIDIWIDGGLGGATAVRFWIGTEDAKGSIKAKAAVEDGHWHTHGEVPDPLPAGSMLWVEIESKDSKKSVVSFELKL